MSPGAIQVSHQLLVLAPQHILYSIKLISVSNHIFVICCPTLSTCTSPLFFKLRYIYNPCLSIDTHMDHITPSMHHHKPSPTAPLWSPFANAYFMHISNIYVSPLFGISIHSFAYKSKIYIPISRHLNSQHYIIILYITYTSSLTS